MNQQRPHAPTDYMEALQTDGQFDVGASLVKSLASLLVVVSGSAIGREGAMILLASLAASSFARRFTPREEWKIMDRQRRRCGHGGRLPCAAGGQPVYRGNPVRYLNAGFPRPGCRFRRRRPANHPSIKR